MTDSDYILACDEGTSSARSLLFDRYGSVIAEAQEPIECSFPQSGWVEQNADDIWQAQYNTIRKVINQCPGGSRNIAAMGITNQRETTVVWDRKTGRPIAPAIVWQCRRTNEYCERLKQKSLEEQICIETGLVIDAYFSASKIRWILDNVEDAQSRAENGELAFGTIDSWLIYQLTASESHIIDRTNASRTMLMNLELATWSSTLLKEFDIPRCMMPEIVPSTSTVAVAHFGSGINLPIAGIAGDQQAALVGQSCTTPGMVKNTYGTGCFALMHTGYERVQSTNRLLTTTAASQDRSQNEYALEGSVFTGGAVIQWLRDELQLFSNVEETETIVRSVVDTNGVYFVPAFTGLGAPHWDAEARGIITGISRGASKAHIVRAALESIAYQTTDLIDAMVRDSQLPLTELRVDGGASANSFLMQFQADLLNVPVSRPRDPETTAWGAAYLAGLSVDFWGDLSAHESQRVRYSPRMSQDQREGLIGEWRKAVERALVAPRPSEMS